jgi:hypothetical protein
MAQEGYVQWFTRESTRLTQPWPRLALIIERLDSHLFVAPPLC